MSFEKPPHARLLASWMAAVCFLGGLAIDSSCQDLQPGIHYEHRKTSEPWSIHILIADPALCRIAPTRALNDGVGRETVSSIASRKGALAAINSGFFRIGGRYDGEPEGILKIGSQWFSDPGAPRGAAGWRDGRPELMIGRLAMRLSIAVAGKTYPVDGINRPRAVAEAILYTWSFHRSTLTDPGGQEWLISGNRIMGVLGQGDAPIPFDGFVYSIGPQSALGKLTLKKNQHVQVSMQLDPLGARSPEEIRHWQEMDYLVGGAGVLITDGNPATTWSEEKIRPGFDIERHPRTALGIRADGKWVLVVVDGRQPGLSVGMTLGELAGEMKRLGCTSALNLDGGGSSTLVFGQKVMNSPSDAGKERPVSDAILVLPLTTGIVPGRSPTAKHPR